MKKIPKKKLGPLLNNLYDQFNFKEYIRRDPIEFLHRYNNPKDIEIVGLISSSIAYGRIDLFKPVIRNILEIMGKSPSQYVLRFSPKRELNKFQKWKYRMTCGVDMACLIHAMQKALREYGTLRQMFYSFYQKSHTDIEKALTQMTKYFCSVDATPIYGENIHPRGYSFLFPAPTKGSPCKRLNLFLRWMVRGGDGVDFGIWNKIPSSKLIIPLDIHISRAANYLSLSNMKNPSWKMAREITKALKEIDPVDPVRFDFSLCHLTMSGKLPQYF
jgi:uncharacterized protein (TIGR02757 family)